MMKALPAFLRIGRKRPPRSTTLLAAAAVLSTCCLASSPALAATNKAVAFGWPVAGDTEVAYSSFFGAQHTIAFRFMPQYPTGYEGPIVTTVPQSGPGTFSIGQGNYAADGVDAKRLFVDINGTKWHFVVPSLTAGVWAHVAVVRRAPVNGITKFRVYLDGTLLTASNALGPDLSYGSVATPTGAIRLGRTDPSLSGTDQVYGLVDDLAIFDGAMSDAGVADLANNVLQLTGNETHLLWGFTFDSPTPASGPLSGAVTWHNLPQYPFATVSADRDSVADRAMMPLPNMFYAPGLILPFKPGQAWTVTQPFGGALSHNGNAAFSLDLALRGAETPGKFQYPWEDGPSCGEPVFASQSGTFEVAGAGGLPSARDEGILTDPIDKIDYLNSVRIVHGPSTRSVYLHLQTLSVREVYPGVDIGDYGPLIGGMRVNKFREIARVGNGNGCHLHQSVNNAGNSSQANFPFAYNNYEACDAQLGFNCELPWYWYPVSYGVPAEGQWVRNPL